MDHINATFDGDSNNIVLGEVSTDWGKTFSDLVRLIGL